MNSSCQIVRNHDPESAERARLAEVQSRLTRAIQAIDERLACYQQDIQAQRTYLWESKADMDHVEKVTTRQAIQQMVMTGDTILAQKQRLLKLARSTRRAAGGPWLND